jgi:hypothetical protein
MGFETRIGVQLAKNYMDPENSLLWLKEPITVPCPEPAKSISPIPVTFLKNFLKVTTYYVLDKREFL